MPAQLAPAKVGCRLQKGRRKADVGERAGGLRRPLVGPRRDPPLKGVRCRGVRRTVPNLTRVGAQRMSRWREAAPEGTRQTGPVSSVEGVPNGLSKERAATVY